MIDLLEICNFKNLNNLKLSSLGQINLLTGKNNTGKSTILEAISLYASKGDLNIIFKNLDERGENYRSVNTNKSPTDVNLRALSSLFTNRQINFFGNNSLIIRGLERKLQVNLFNEPELVEKFVSLRFVHFYNEIASEDNDDPSMISRKRVIIDDELDNLIVDSHTGLEIKTENGSSIISIDRDRPNRFAKSASDAENFQFIRTKNIDRDINGKLWDDITLSEKEMYVIEALKIIEPNVERIAFIEEFRDRTPVIKLRNNNNILPLKSMGDGINRVLTIILALVNADNGFLLIDEFENGLHFSVQEKLWTVIFNLAKRLNIQVFATTHSEDCIKGFEQVLNNYDKQATGKLIRLDFVDHIIKQVEYDANELRIASEHNIETR